ncbi:MAG TPA: hypothetical protein PKH39_05970 [Woeseiaceae bacterium]|nr:hypothetical protein [Woeseiaceae bacterium]
MNRSDLDWDYIRRFTTRPLISAIIAIAALLFALWTHNEHKALFTELSANRVAVHEDYESLIAQRRLVDRYHRRYQQYYELGFIGRENRLDVVETMRTTTAELDLPRVSYTIEPQSAVVAPVTSFLGGENIQVRVSKLQLEMGLIHEIDLLRFFDVLQSQAPGMIKVDRCELANIGDTSSTPGDPNLSANCEVNIFSVITSDVHSGEST